MTRAGRKGSEPLIRIGCRAPGGCAGVIETTARLNNPIICPECGTRQRVLRADRPDAIRHGTAQPAAAEPERGQERPADAAGTPASGPWDSEPERVTVAAWHADSCPPEWRCPDCGSGLRWSARKTSVGCPGCGRWASPPRVADRAAVRRADIARRASNAIAARPDAAAGLRATIALGVEREKLARAIRSWQSLADPDLLPSGHGLIPLAVQTNTALGCLLKELSAVADAAGLRTVLAVFREIVEPVKPLQRDFRNALRPEPEPAALDQAGYDDDEYDGDEQAGPPAAYGDQWAAYDQAANDAARAAVLGYVPPDPNWRANATPAGRAMQARRERRNA